MNESVYIYLKLEDMDVEKRINLINKVDKLLLPTGLKYSGFRNMYLPQDNKRRDDIMFNAIHTLKTCDWLEGIYDHVIIGNRCYDGNLDEIDCSQVTMPKKSKMAYYEAYYLKTNCLPHGILIDENNHLEDGYCSYLLAQKYHLKQNVLDGVDIYQVESSVPYKKLVIGRHVVLKESGISVKSEKRYVWICDIKAPVVPGDVLLVRTGKGKDFMIVDKVAYEAGTKNLEKYKKVIKHTGRRIEQAGMSNESNGLHC